MNQHENKTEILSRHSAYDHGHSSPSKRSECFRYYFLEDTPVECLQSSHKRAPTQNISEYIKIVPGFSCLNNRFSDISPQ